MRITINQVMNWEPCEEYSIERVTALFSGRDTLTIADVFALSISARDKLWVLLHEECVLAPTLHEFACRCAEQALKWISDPDPRSVAAIAARRACLRGEISDQDMAAAADAARVAAWAASSDASSAAAWDAATAAHCAAASAAVRDAASDASSTAASAAAWSAACVTAQDASRDAAGVANYMSTPNSNLELLKNLLKDSQDGTVYSS
jgi:hypothetical protein